MDPPILQTNEQWLRMVFDAAQLSAWSWELATDVVTNLTHGSASFSLRPGLPARTIDAIGAAVYPADLPVYARAVAAAREQGEPPRFQMRVLGPDGHLRWLDVQGLVQPDEGGRPAWVVGVTRDITAEKRRESAQSFHNRITQALAPDLDTAATLEALARMALPELGDACAIFLFDDAGRLSLAAGRDKEGVGNWAPVAHQGAAPPVPGSALLDAVVRDGVACIVASTPPELAALLGVSAPRSTLLVPLLADGPTLGVMALVLAAPGRHYDAHDLALAEALARRGAKALYNARLRAAAHEAEQIAAAAHARLDALVRSAPSGIGYLDREVRYVLVNPALAAINGRAPEDHLGRTVAEMLPNLAPLLEPSIRHVLATGEATPNVELHGKPCFVDGLVHDWLISYFPVHGPQREVVGVGVTVADLTASKRTEAALRESQQNLASLIENTDGIIWSIDTGYHLIVANSLFHRVVGSRLGRELLPGECLVALPLPPEALAEWRAWYDRALAGERFSVEAPTRFATASGTAEYRFSPIRTAEGSISGVTVFGRDISERLRAEQALRDTERKLGTLFELLPVGIAIVDAGDTIAYVNPALEQILRLDRASLFSGAHRARRYMRSDGTPMPSDEYASALSLDMQHRMANVETGIVAETGEVIWTSVSAAPVDFPDWRAVIVTTDITQHKAAEEQVRAALAAEQAARLAAEAATERTMRLQAVTAALAGALTRDAVIAVMTDHGVAATGASIAVIGQLDTADEQLKLLGWSGRSAEELAAFEPLPLSAELPMTAAVRTMAPVWVTSRVDADGRFPGFGAVMDQFGAHALAALPLTSGERVLGVMCFVYDTPNSFSAEEQAFLLNLAQQNAQALERVRLYTEVLASQERLQSLSQRLLETQEQERRHLARELHDEVGQALTGLRLALEVASRLPPGERDARLAEAHQTTQELIGKIRTLSLDLRPAMLDDHGLLPALLWQLKRYQELTGIEVELHHWGLDRRLPPAVETVAYRVVQEALTNVARHAGVATATVRLLASPAQLLVQVRDAGRGFVLEAVPAQPRSNGLAGMQERMALLGGRLSIETAPGEGTCVTAELPLYEEPKP